MYLKIGQFCLEVNILCTTYVLAVSNSVGYIDSQVRQKRETLNTAPSFAQDEYRAAVLENQAPGLSVILITATDPDQGENGKLTYSMMAIRDSRSNDMFTINPISGKVTTTIQLDREEIPRHDFRVMATDNSPIFKMSAVATLIINVEDENDHTPTFDQAVYKVEKQENIPIATSITTVRAIDKDMGKNQDIRYSITEPSNPTMFKIDPISGSISTLKVLDREVQANYELVVMAKDQADFGKQRSSTATIEIKVQDENDNFPQFSQQSYTVNVTENLDISSRPVIAHVSATDADEGLNQDISYSITGGNIDDTFYIDPTTGDVSVQKPLDYEVYKDYNLKIKAADSGNPPRTNSTNLWVRINDLNDNLPYFQKPVYTGSVVEGEKTGSRVLTVRALDKDSGVNGQVEYFIINVPPAFPFVIDAGSGAITVRATLDREIQPSYSFTVQVKDKGQPQLSATVSVEITVNHVNDNSPIFPQSKTYHFFVSENAAIGTSVGAIQAIDNDVGVDGEITYELLTWTQAFVINSSSGEIRTRRLLDREAVSVYSFEVRASDNGANKRHDNAGVTVTVEDVNDNPPFFMKQVYEALIRKPVISGKGIITVHAVDFDFGINSQVRYQLSPANNTRNNFEIDSMNGAIRVAKSNKIDTESVVNYTLRVVATDLGVPPLSATTEVRIMVEETVIPVG